MVETSLGYYINPLVTVLLGVALLGERMRSWQWFALTIGALAVVVLSWELGRPPWIALILAFSFGAYGLLKKTAGVGPIEGLMWEALVLAPLAVGYLSWLSYAGQATAWSQGFGHVLLLSSTGLVTAIPLLCFAGAANRIPLSTVGLLQYIGPTLQFLIGVFVYHETMGPLRWAGFSLVWLALAILTADSVVAYRRRSAERRDVETEQTQDHPEALEAGAVLDKTCLPR
ncbi:MAG: EamA family transporter RarD [Nocardioidaceae bacterium]